MIKTTQDKKKIYKAMTVAGTAMDRQVGREFTIEDVVQFETDATRKSEDGFESEITAVATSIFATDGTMYTTISPTVDKCLANLAEVFGEDGLKGLNIRIVNGVSNSGRKFLQLDLI